MTSTTRIRLESLRDAILDDKFQAELEAENTVPARLLAKHKVRLQSHTFSLNDTAQKNQGHEPQILFYPRSPDLLDDCPINWQGYGKERGTNNSNLEFPAYNPPPDTGDIHQTVWAPEIRGQRLASYLSGWALGDFRILPSGVSYIGELCGIVRVNWHLHGLDIQTPGFFYFGSRMHNTWESLIYEYQVDAQTSSPHVILITSHSCSGTNGSITHGELGAIITAMRNRARQPKTELEESESDEPDSLPESPKEPTAADLLFPDEQTFPVLMVSILHPQQARISYACISSSDIVIRQSELYDFRQEAAASLELFACMLLSYPLTEAQKRPEDVDKQDGDKKGIGELSRRASIIE